MSLNFDPLAYYNGDSGVDNTGNGNDLTLSNISIETVSPLVGAESFSLNGIDSHGKMVLPSSFKTQRFCVRAFVELDATHSSLVTIMAALPGNGFNGRGWLLDVSATRQVRWLVSNNAGGFIVVTSIGTLNTGTKYFIEADYDGSNVNVYINNSLDNSTAFTGTVDWIDGGASPSPATFYIGASRTANLPLDNIPDTRFFNGLIEGGVWDEARDAHDSNIIYKDGTGREYPFPTDVERNKNFSQSVRAVNSSKSNIKNIITKSRRSDV